MRGETVDIWKSLSRFTQGLVLIMVSILFFAWGVFGSAQVENQTQSIIQGVHDDLEQTTSIIVENQAILLAEGRYITCILTTLPEKRRPKTIHRCYRESGLKKLRDSSIYFVGEVNP